MQFFLVFHNLPSALGRQVSQVHPAPKRDDIVRLVSGKKEETKNESEQLHEIIHHQKTIIELLKDKIKGLGGSV